MNRSRFGASGISAMLAHRIQLLAAALLPSGKRVGAEWRCGSVAGDPGMSLGVHLRGERAGLWSDFATGERGDALDLVAAVLFRGDIGQALRWAASWLGLADGERPAPLQRLRMRL